MKNQITQLVEQAERIKQAILNQIAALPDNPRINRINDRCFTMSSADLGPESILSPQYHDFKATYRTINKELQTKTPQGILSFLTTLAKKGTIRLDAQNYTMKIHPDVQAYLKKLIY